MAGTMGSVRAVGSADDPDGVSGVPRRYRANAGEVRMSLGGAIGS